MLSGLGLEVKVLYGCRRLLSDDVHADLGGRFCFDLQPATRMGVSGLKADRYCLWSGDGDEKWEEGE